MSPKKLYLLDAYALIFRAYYALMRSPRVTSKGKNTNAQFGFTNTLIELLNKEKPTHIAVCFDKGGSVEREADYADYKANRQETPEDLLAAVPDIIKIIEGFNIPVISKEGYEADDIIGTLAWQADDAGFEVFMVTPDKDYGQLVREKIKIYKPAYQGGNVEIMGIQEVCQKWDIERIDQVVDILGLMGDAVDNIPGIKGVGEKTAAKLLKEYDKLENVLDNAENIKGSLGEKVRAGKEMALLSKKLATINTDVPVSFDENACVFKPFDRNALMTIFGELEFRTLGKRILGDNFSVGRNLSGAAIQTNLFGEPIDTAAENNPQNNIHPSPEQNSFFSTIDTIPHEYPIIRTLAELQNLVQLLNQQSSIVFDVETTGLDATQASLVGLSFAYQKHLAFYVPYNLSTLPNASILPCLQPLFDSPNLTWVGHNIKYDLIVLRNYGIHIKGKIYDTMLAHYVIEPEGKSGMDQLSLQFLNYEPVSIETLIGKKGKGQGSMQDVPIEKIAPYAAEDVDITLQLKEKIQPLVIENEVENLLETIENPLIPVLVNMESEGIRVNETFLNDYSQLLEKEAKIAEEKIYKLAGSRFNISSPKQLGEVLFDKLQLEANPKKTKTKQYQTGEDILLKLSAKGFEIAEDILTFRELIKLKSTYVDALPLLIHPKTGRIHTSYAQAVAVTGRLSSNNPNLQNIPIRTERGREIRKAFVPRDENHLLLSADYSQIELRIIAAISGDENMCAAFRAGKDIHLATAAKIYGIEEATVTKEMRYKAKSVNFGIIYGQGAFGLAENLGISRTEAKEIIDNYKKEFGKIQQYMDETIRYAQAHGYVKTLMGRKRWIKDINSSNFTLRSFAERNAINSPIQGTAADMIKMAMIAVDKALEQLGLKTKMLLQVHDELVFDVPKNELEMVEPLIKEKMQTAMLLPNNVPIVVETGVGSNWLEAH